MGLQQFFIRQEEPQPRQHVSRILQKGILLAEQPFHKGQGLFPIAAEEGIHEGEEVLFHGAGKEIGQVVRSDAPFPIGQGDAQFIEFGKDVEQGDAAPGLEQVLQKNDAVAAEALALFLQISCHIGHDIFFRSRLRQRRPGPWASRP